MSLYSLRRMAVDVPSPAVPLYSPPGASDTFPSPTSMADPLPSLKPNLAIILVGLGFTFMLVCAFALFAKCMNPHLQRRRNLGWNLDLESPRGGDKDGPGVDPSVINALPLVFYKRRASSSLKRSGSTTDLEKALGSSKSRYRELEAECAVCLSIFEEGEQLRQLPECRHSFHPQCVDSWLGSHPSCPLCRRSILPSHDKSAAFVPQESQRLRIGDLSDAVVASSRGGVADADSSAGTVAALQQSPEIIVLGDVPGLRTPSPQHLPAVGHIPSSPIAAGSGNEDQVGVGSPSDNLQKPAYVADFVAVPVNESSNLREGPQGEGINAALPAVTSASPRHSGAP